MEVTAIGWILIPLGFWLYLFSPARLYPFTVFSIFFSATAVVNVGSAGSYSGLQATMFFGALWMVSEISEIRGRRHTNTRPEIKRPVTRLVIFLGIVVLSLIMPIWISRGITIDSPEFANPESTALQFTFRYITQAAYIAYGVCLAIFVAFKNVDVQEFKRSLRILTISGIFISLWGFFQFSCNLLGIEYPAYIFNTSKAESAQGFTQELADLGVQRVSSVTTEPSVFAQCLLVILVFVLFAVVSSKPLISKGWDRFALVVILGGLLVSTSTTAYVGIAVLAVLCIPAFLYIHILRPRHALVMGLFAGALAMAYFAYGTVQDLVGSMLVGKGESYSAMARLLSVLMARDYFLQYPILGLGWGSVTSDDLIFKLLSNTGILGFLSFSVFLITVFRCLWQSIRAAKPLGTDLQLLPVSMLVAFVLLIFINATSGFVYAYSHVWFVFGLAIAVPAFFPYLKVSEPFSTFIPAKKAIV